MRPDHVVLEATFTELFSRLQDGIWRSVRGSGGQGGQVRGGLGPQRAGCQAREPGEAGGLQDWAGWSQRGGQQCQWSCGNKLRQN